MSPRRDLSSAAAQRAQAPVFAALGDRTRLRLLRKLSLGPPQSITGLAADFKVTRQALTKHLRVLENAGLVAGGRRGREMRFNFVPGRIAEAAKYLELVSDQWEQALNRLKSFVES
jgi:DNA-binding transcriptional ArsR family regulator